MLYDSGGFHIGLNFLIGQHFEDSGLKDVWVDTSLFNEFTAAKLIEGKFWNRSVRAHKLTYDAVWRCLWFVFIDWCTS